MSEDEKGVDEEPSGRVSNRDLWRISAAMNDRSSTIERGMQSVLEHVDSGFNDLRANMLDLRQIVNEQLHAQDKRIGEIAAAVEPMKRGWDVRVALLRGSWRLTTTMLVAAGSVGGLIARFGLPWEWGR